LKRGEKGLLANQWEFPCVEIVNDFFNNNIENNDVSNDISNDDNEKNNEKNNNENNCNILKVEVDRKTSNSKTKNKQKKVEIIDIENFEKKFLKLLKKKIF
jgi:adenine-specific DNA glycosylase